MSKLYKNNQAFCKHCFQYHPLQYLDDISGKIHLIYRCMNKKNKTVFLPYISGLNISRTISKKQLRVLQKEDMASKQLALF